MNRARIYHRAQQVLPSVIETSGMQRFAMSQGQLECMLLSLLVRCETHGAVVLQLSDDAADAIRRDGLAYFEGATVARGALSRRGPARYAAWRRSPLPEEWGRAEAAPGLWPGVGHVDVGAGMGRRLSKAWQDGAYYTQERAGGAWLVVLPDERLVVYSWWD
ncbi:hypothetical protein [Pseudoxanthomonas sp. PXM01]|uniref:hypothetical protein n=1 Tax=Pseudoxanthomonas sp. PXM01 TaxID=2769295 RepID=UPI00177BB78B|nr:hypothetical protein [Pseudoxanthomonas sp. PXM01]MBD9469365.1 hypothetical protein [Pseudoxanthomonas sp. PXM01]